MKTITKVEVDAEDLLSFINFVDNNCTYGQREWSIREYLYKRAAVAVKEGGNRE